MTRLVRAALTETVNAYGSMPATVDELHLLAGRLDEVRQANLDHHLELVRRAAQSGVQVLGLGELFAGPYFALGRDPMWLELAEDAAQGPTVRTMSRAAKEHGLVLVVPIYELCARSGKRFNAAVVIDEQGELLGKYRKTHIPEGSNEQGTFCETFYYERSDGQLGTWPRNISSNAHFPVFETSFGRIAVAICYDRHFEGVMRTLARQGAELVFSPAVTFGHESRRMWELEFAVDAARHGIYIGGSNRRGSEPPWNQEDFGGSRFVGPAGELTPVGEGDGLVVVDLDLDLLSRSSASGWDLARDERPELYSD